MTTLHVRLPIVVDSERPERCSGRCQFMRGPNACRVYGDLEGVAVRAANCVAATAADELRERVVLAAGRLCDVAPPDLFTELTEAVDALRSATKGTP